MSVQAITWAIEQDISVPAQKLLLICLANYANEDGVCWPGQKRLARDCSMTERSVRTHVKALEDAGYLTRKARRRDSDQTRTSDEYTLNISSRKNLPVDAGPTGKSASDLPEKNDQSHRKYFPGMNQSEEPLGEPCAQVRVVTPEDLQRIEQTYPKAGLVNVSPQAMLAPIGKAVAKLGGMDALIAAMSAYRRAIDDADSLPVSLRKFLDPHEGLLDRYAQPAEPQDDWPKRLAMFFQHGFWSRKWGPDPDSPACKAPAELIRQAQERAA